MGLLLGLRTLDPPLGPLSTTEDIFSTHVWGGINSKHFCLKRKSPPQFSHLISYSFCEIKPHVKFQNPRTTPSGKKVTWGEREREIDKKRRSKWPLRSACNAGSALTLLGKTNIFSLRTHICINAWAHKQKVFFIICNALPPRPTHHPFAILSIILIILKKIYHVYAFDIN